MADAAIEPTSSPADTRASGRVLWILVGVFAVALLACLCVALRGGNDSGSPITSRIEAHRYQAVFLTNDRVYFGHLRALGGDWYELRDAYFIREKAATGKDTAAARQVAPISEELKQPGKHMLINARAIVQVENLKASSSVTQAIQDLDN
jgi:hypothetical protein